MIELPIIDLDMSRKDIVYKIPQLAFDAEDGVYLVRLRPVGYDWTDKVARINCALKGSKTGYTSDDLDVTDGVVSWQASAAVLRPGKNLLQLNIYGEYTEFRQIAPVVEWYLREALPGTDPMPDDVDAIEGLTAQVNTAVASLDDVRTACESNALTAEEKAEAATQALAQTTAALQQVLAAIGDTICPLGVDKKVPPENISLLTSVEWDEITDEAELVTLDRQKGDHAILIEEIDGERTTVKGWTLLGTGDPTIRDNWVLQGADYATKAASALYATNATNSDTVDGIHVALIDKADYLELVEWPPNTVYGVRP